MQWADSITDRIIEETHFGHRKLKCFKDRPANVNDMFTEALASNPDGEAVVAGHNAEMRLTYHALNSRVAAVAAGLESQGIAPGDRVAMLIGNNIEFLVVLLATLRIGAIAVPVNIREQTPELTYILNHCGATSLIYDQDLAEKLPRKNDLPHLKHRFAINNNTTFKGADYTELLSTAAIETPAAINEEDVAVILYTSGTTGRPKGAMLTHFNIVHSTMHFELCMEMQRGERSILAVPASHVTGLVAILATMLRVAGCSVMMPVFEAESFLTLAAQEKITQTLMVPAMYNLFLLRCNTEDYDLSAWRIGGYGGAPMPQPTIKTLAQKLPNLLLINAYGSTEATSPATMLPPGTGTTRSDSVGIALPCADIRVVNEQGHEVAEGEHGELWIGGPMMVPGYWNNPEKTQAEFCDGYWKSGDIGSRDSQGFFQLHDRRKDMIIRGGYNIYSAELENAITAIDGVAECAAIGKPDPVLGEKSHVIIYTDSENLTTDQIKQHCHRHLADYKIPDYITFTEAPLPRNANGKVIKRELREMFL